VPPLKLPNLRVLYGEDGKTAEAELDAVVRVTKGADQPPVMYIGSMKTYTEGKVAESCLALWPPL
jgi:hypothetical protein